MIKQAVSNQSLEKFQTATNIIEKTLQNFSKSYDNALWEICIFQLQKLRVQHELAKPILLTEHYTLSKFMAKLWTCISIVFKIPTYYIYKCPIILMESSNRDTHKCKTNPQISAATLKNIHLMQPPKSSSYFPMRNATWSSQIILPALRNNCI